MDYDRKFTKIILRNEWGAEPARSEETLKSPVPNVVFMATGTEHCNSQESCTKIIKDLQKWYMEEKGLDDIPWSFIVGGDENTYEGRGWNIKPIKTDRENVKLMRYDGKSLDIAYIGNFDQFPPEIHQAEVALALVGEGVRLNILNEDKIEYDSFILTDGTTTSANGEILPFQDHKYISET